jgi:hypothetical protein
MTTTLIVHPHASNDIGLSVKAGLQASIRNPPEILATLEDDIYVGPYDVDRVHDSTKGELPESFLHIARNETSYLIRGGMHGRCTYVTLNDLIVHFLRGDKKSYTIAFDATLTYAMVANINEQSLLYVGAPEQQHRGWSSDLKEMGNGSEAGRYVDGRRLLLMPLHRREPESPNTFPLSYIMCTNFLEPSNVYQRYIWLLNSWQAKFAARLRQEENVDILGFYFTHSFTFEGMLWRVDLRRA